MNLAQVGYIMGFSGEIAILGWNFNTIDLLIFMTP